jgi:hypothetical protein
MEKKLTKLHDLMEPEAEFTSVVRLTAEPFLDEIGATG